MGVGRVMLMVPSWLEPRGEIFKIIDNSGQLFPIFLSLSIEGDITCIIYYVNAFRFNTQLSKRVTDGSFSSLCIALVFLSAFLEFGGRPS